MLLSRFSPPDANVRHQQPNTHAFIEGNDAGSGCLYIAESQVSWLSEGGDGFSLEYPKISLHAVSRDLSAFPRECLYVQVEGKLIEDETENSSSDEEGQNDFTPMTEVRFVPADKYGLEPMFSAMSSCQALHPDPEDEDLEEGQFYEGEDGLEHLSEQGEANLQHIENLLQAGQGDGGAIDHASNGDVEPMEEHEDEGQFDDADMEEH